MNYTYYGIEAANEILIPLDMRLVPSPEQEHYEIQYLDNEAIAEDTLSEEEALKPNLLLVAIWSDEISGKSEAKFLITGVMNVWTSQQDISRFEKALLFYGEILDKLNRLEITAINKEYYA